MNKRLTSKLLTSSAVIAIVAVSTATLTHAADVNSGTRTTTLIATTNDEVLSVTGTGSINVTTQSAIEPGSFTGIDVVVNTTGGVTASGNNIAIDGDQAGSSIDTISVLDGFVTSDATRGTITLSGITSTINISTSAQGSIANTVAGGEAILIDDDDMGQTFTVVVNNDGSITTTNDAGSNAILIRDTDSVSTLAVNNTGIINAGALGAAITGENSNTVDLDNTGAGAITGLVRTQMGALNILNTNTATINGNISTNTGALTLDIDGGTVTGDVATNSGLTDVDIAVGTLDGNISTSAGNLTLDMVSGAVDGNVTSTSGNQTTNIDGGIFTGNMSTVSGDTDIEVDGGTLTGDVNLGNSATGALDVTTGTLTGDVTMGNAAQIFTYTGGTFAGDVNGAGQFHVNTNFTNQGIGNLVNVTEVEVDNAAILTVGQNIMATNVNIDNGTIDFGNTASRTITGNLTIGSGSDSRIDVQGMDHIVTGLFTMNTGDTFGVNVAESGNTADQAGRLIVNSANIAMGSLLDVDLGTSEFIANGQTYVLVDGTVAGTINIIDAANIDVNNSSSNKAGLITFTTTTDGTDLTLLASRSTLNAVANNPNSSSLGAALEIIGANGDDDGTEVETFIDAILDSSTEAEANAILESGTPATDNSLSQGIIEAATHSIDVVNTRLADARTGLSSGDYSRQEYGAWIQGFGGFAEQDTVNGINGYDANTYGVAVGIDTKINPEFTIGLSGSYANTDIENNSGLKDTDVNTYQLNLYGSYDRNNYFVDGVIGAAYNKYDTTRDIVAPASTAQADFDGQTYLGKVTTGYQHLSNHGIEITPTFGLLYAYNTVDDYTETGAGALSLDVDQDDAQRLEAKLGINVAKTYTLDGGMNIRPQVRAAVGHDFIGDEQVATSNFQGIGTTFRTTGADIEKTSYELGAGLDIMNEGGLTFSTNYDYQGRDNYSSHIGSVKARINF